VLGGGLDLVGVTSKARASKESIVGGVVFGGDERHDSFCEVSLRSEKGVLDETTKQIIFSFLLT